MRPVMGYGGEPDPLDITIQKKIGHESAWVMVRMPYKGNVDGDGTHLHMTLHGTPASPAEFLLALEGVVSSLRNAFRMQGVCPDEATDALEQTLKEELGEA